MTLWRAISSPFGVALIFALLCGAAAGAGAVRLTLDWAQERADRRRRDARKAIFTAIDEALLDALKATGGASISAAERLAQCVDVYCADILKFSTEVGDPLSGIRKSLKTKVKEPAKAPPPAPPAPPPPPQMGAALILGAAGHAAAGGGSASASAAGGGAASASVSSPQGGISLVSPAIVVPLTFTDNKLTATAAPPAPPSPPAPPEQVERELSLLEQRMAVRQAVEAFAEIWRKERIEDLLKNAQSALLDVSPPPKEPPPGH